MRGAFATAQDWAKAGCVMRSTGFITGTGKAETGSARRVSSFSNFLFLVP